MVELNWLDVGDYLFPSPTVTVSLPGSRQYLPQSRPLLNSGDIA